MRIVRRFSPKHFEWEGATGMAAQAISSGQQLATFAFWDQR